MAVNRYAAPCSACGAMVAPKAGNLTKSGRRWVVTHLSCASGAGVDVYNIGGNEYTRNKAGRCEDAPCCGCCTI